MTTKKLNLIELLKKQKILIPLIQRDYAQGRKSEEKKAKKFLEAIKKGLQNGLSLDFIYGYQENKNFIPIDGQQRLTTLFLLYFYANLEGKFDEELLKNLQNFNYEVRESCSDFLKALVERENYKMLEKRKIRQNIENQKWFFKSWKNDHSINAMLQMFEWIEKIFKYESFSLEKITFDFFDMNEYKLGEKLYVKMNARGKMLSDFENFKCKFEDLKEFKDLDLNDKIKNSLDNEWLNLFWQIANEGHEKGDSVNQTDKMFYNFFENLAVNFYFENENFKNDKIDENDIKIINNISLFDIYEKVFDEKNIKNLQEILDYLVENYKKFNETQKEVFLEFIGKKEETTKRDDEEKDAKFTYHTRLKFYAFCLLIINKIDINSSDFKSFQRVALNLINNTQITNLENFQKIIKELKKLNINNIYENLENLQISYFDKEQINEEKLKAKLILTQPNLEDEFIKLEQNWYLNGQIGYIIEFATKDEFCLESFKEYAKKFIAIWDFAKWDFAKNEKDNQILFYQALLSKGNYLPKIGDNHTFCSFAPNLRAKNDNWRKVFKDKEKNIHLKNLLDENLDIFDIEKSLKKIKQSPIAKEDWIFKLINSDDSIKYCKKLLVRFLDKKYLAILSTTRIFGYWAELNSYVLFYEKFEPKPENKRISGLDFSPFGITYYKYVKNEGDYAGICLDEFSYNEKYNFFLDILFDKQGFCRMEFCDVDDKNFSGTEVAKILEKLNFKIINNENKSLLERKFGYILKINETEILPKINEICEALNSSN